MRLETQSWFDQIMGTEYFPLFLFRKIAIATITTKTTTKTRFKKCHQVRQNWNNSWKSRLVSPYSYA
jgi:hypothetical protein